MSTFLYIAANPARDLFIGVTRDLETTMQRHRAGDLDLPGVDSHDRLVLAEEFDSVTHAMARYREIASLPTRDALELVRNFNPGWRDLHDEFVVPPIKVA